MHAATSAATPTSSARRLPDPAITIAVLALLSLALFPLEIHRAFGLPAHPLIIHAPVIFIPCPAVKDHGNSPGVITGIPHLRGCR